MSATARRAAGQRGPLDALLGSRTRAHLLTLFCTHPGEEFYTRRLAATTGLALGHVHRELTRLAHLGLIHSRRMGREKLYHVNKQHPLYPELKRIVYKTTALGSTLREALADVPGVETMFIYGSVAKGTEDATSDIDLFVLGTPDRTQLDAGLSDAEERLGREVNLITMTTDEWRRRRAAREGFIEVLLRSPKIFLVGDEQSLPDA